MMEKIVDLLMLKHLAAENSGTTVETLFYTFARDSSQSTHPRH
jgi:hypothetical protein